MELTAAEGQRRHKGIAQFNEREDYIGYIVSESENAFYMSNFLLDVQTWERPVAAIFPRQGEPLFILNELSTHHFELAVDRGSCWISQAEIYVEHPRQVNRTYTLPEWDRLFVDVLRRQGMTSGRIAVDNLNIISPAIRAALPDLSFHSRPDAVRDLRLVKSEEELNILRLSGEVTDWAQSQYREVLTEGEYIIDIDMEVARRFAHYMAERYGEADLEIKVASSTGPLDTSCPHRPGANSGRRVERGHGILNVVKCRINGYGVENERTWFIGEPSPEQKRCFELMHRAQAAATAAMVEGNIMADIDSAGQRVYEQAGMGGHVMHRTGHGIAFAAHEYPHDMAFNYRPLKAGMVFSSEPALFVPGLGGFRHSDTVIVGCEEPEITTRYSRELEDLVVT